MFKVQKINKNISRKIILSFIIEDAWMLWNRMQSSDDEKMIL